MVSDANGEIWHYAGDFSGCTGKGCSCCATHPRRQAYCGETKGKRLNPLFPLGRIVATPGALAAIGISGDDLSTYLARHQSGDWGEVDAHDRKENQFSLEQGF